MPDQPESTMTAPCTNEDSAELYREFRDAYDYYNKELLGVLRGRYGDLPEGVFQWIQRVNDYNIPGGKESFCLFLFKICLF